MLLQACGKKNLYKRHRASKQNGMNITLIGSKQKKKSSVQQIEG